MDFLNLKVSFTKPLPEPSYLQPEYYKLSSWNRETGQDAIIPFAQHYNGS